jgi:hypothetical protein
MALVNPAAQNALDGGRQQRLTRIAYQRVQPALVEGIGHARS